MSSRITSKSPTIPENEPVLRQPKRRIVTPVRIVIVLIVFGLLVVSFFPKTPNLSVLASAKLMDINGQSFSFADFRGKVVLLDFMASWCPHCKAEEPYLIKVFQQYGDSIVMVSISQWNQETDQSLAAFKNSFSGADWIFARDTANLWTNLKLIDLPTVIILDKQGSIKFQEGAAVAPITNDTLSAAISPLL